jgi:PIN domain nuclease of toxin-antitoxin system
MNAIIDTHVFLWVITAPEKLSEKALQIIESKANDIFLSPVSCWEIVIKYQVNKLDLSENLNSLILEQIKKSEIKILPITVEHTLNILQLPLLHKYPFDRLLISQALVENLPIITYDSLIRKYEGVNVIW